MSSSPQHVSLGAGKEVDTLDDIEEDFVLAILDAIRPPGHGIGHHLTDPVKQTKQHRDVGVAPGGRHDVHVAHLRQKPVLKSKQTSSKRKLGIQNCSFYD